MKIPLFQVDAFTGRLFGGNPAAVCLLESWLDDHVLQSIATENNLSETAFLIPREGCYDLRWFTPKAEIDLAGHPTLAAAHVVFELLEPGLSRVRFLSPSGPLTVTKEEDRLAMDFPSRPGKPCPPPEPLLRGLKAVPKEVLLARDHLAVFETEDQVLALSPDMAALSELDSMAVIVTAPGREVDFVSRFFAPKMGIPEDPVTGSAHCTLIPYWSERLGKKELRARQVSERIGELWCRDQGERVTISGQAVLFLEGQIHLGPSLTHQEEIS